MKFPCNSHGNRSQQESHEIPHGKSHQFTLAPGQQGAILDDEVATSSSSDDVSIYSKGSQRRRRMDGPSAHFLAPYGFVDLLQGGAPVRERVQLVNISTISRLG